MIRIPQQHEETIPRTTAEPPRDAARAIYTLPVRKLAGRYQVSSGDQSRASLDAVVVDQAIDLRVDWDGSVSGPGQFEVLVSVGSWQSCELIDPGDLQDVVSPAAAVGERFQARFQRGPDHKGCSFDVKAIPIVWKERLPEQLDPSFVAERGKHYEYESGLQPDSLPWACSVLAGDVQRVTVSLGVGRDYEVWVRLQDPKDPSHWVIQDPIIRTDRGGGDPA